MSKIPAVRVRSVGKKEQSEKLSSKVIGGNVRHQRCGHGVYGADSADCGKHRVRRGRCRTRCGAL